MLGFVDVDPEAGLAVPVGRATVALTVEGLLTELDELLLTAPDDWRPTALEDGRDETED